MSEETTQVDPESGPASDAAAAREAGMQEMRRKFRAMGGEVYVPTKSANPQTK